MNRLLVGVALFFTLFAVNADNPKSLVLQNSVGLWKGELYYLDYQSGRRFSIPVEYNAVLPPDNSVLTKQLVYTDPGVKVYATSSMTFDNETGELVESYFREGKGQLFRYQIDSIAFQDNQNWSLIYSETGEDDNKPAIIKHTLIRAGQNLSSKKEVKFDDSESFFLRNGSNLQLVSDTH